MGKSINAGGEFAAFAQRRQSQRSERQQQREASKGQDATPRERAHADAAAARLRDSIDGGGRVATMTALVSHAIAKGLGVHNGPVSESTRTIKLGERPLNVRLLEYGFQMNIDAARFVANVQNASMFKGENKPISKSDAIKMARTTAERNLIDAQYIDGQGFNDAFLEWAFAVQEKHHKELAGMV